MSWFFVCLLCPFLFSWLKRSKLTENFRISEPTFGHFSASCHLARAEEITHEYMLLPLTLYLVYDSRISVRIWIIGSFQKQLPTCKLAKGASFLDLLQDFQDYLKMLYSVFLQKLVCFILGNILQYILFRIYEQHIAVIMHFHNQQAMYIV